MMGGIDAAAGAPEGGPGGVCNEQTSSRGVAIDLETALMRLGVIDGVYVVVEDIPPGVRLSAGRSNGDDTWSLGPGDLGGLRALLPSARREPFDLTVRVLMPDPCGYEYASTIARFDVAVVAEGEPSAVALVPERPGPPTCAGYEPTSEGRWRPPPAADADDPRAEAERRLAAARAEWRAEEEFRLTQARTSWASHEQDRWAAREAEMREHHHADLALAEATWRRREAERVAAVEAIWSARLAARAARAGSVEPPPPTPKAGPSVRSRLHPAQWAATIGAWIVGFGCVAGALMF